MNSTNDLIKFITSVQTKSERIDWDKYFMSIAILGSIRSSCNRLHVGCVIVKNNRTVSMGYNGFLPGALHNSRIRDNHEQCTIHAEQNAVADAANRGISLEGCVAYITHYPCINCFKILAASGIKKIIYLHDYKNDQIIEELIKDFNNKIIISKIDYI